MSANMYVWSAFATVYICGEQNSDEPNAVGFATPAFVAAAIIDCRLHAVPVFATEKPLPW